MKKILVIDDDADILDALSLVLESENYRVVTTTKGDQTLNMIKRNMPHLILLDVLMSGSDGRVICKKIKKETKYKKIPIVMISAHPSAQQGSMECGADAFLAKPFEIDDLLNTVKKHIL